MRPQALQRFYAAAREALLTLAADQSPALETSRRVFAATERSVGRLQSREAATLDACAHLPEAFRAAAAGPPAVTSLATALEELLPHLTWWRRDNAALAGEPFVSGHANTLVAGANDNALEVREDVIVGASVLAPRIDYPAHSHAPEEVYIALSEGEWYNERDGWYTPGCGGIVHHLPWLTHAMRSGDAPLLAIWCLPVDEA